MELNMNNNFDREAARAMFRVHLSNTGEEELEKFDKAQQYLEENYDSYRKEYVSMLEKRDDMKEELRNLEKRIDKYDRHLNDLFNVLEHSFGCMRSDSEMIRYDYCVSREKEEE